MLGIYIAIARTTDEHQSVDRTLIGREHVVDGARMTVVIRGGARAITRDDLREIETLALVAMEDDV